MQLKLQYVDSKLTTWHAISILDKKHKLYMSNENYHNTEMITIINDQFLCCIFFSYVDFVFVSCSLSYFPFCVFRNASEASIFQLPCNWNPHRTNKIKNSKNGK